MENRCLGCPEASTVVSWPPDGLLQGWQICATKPRAPPHPGTSHTYPSSGKVMNYAKKEGMGEGGNPAGTPRTKPHITPRHIVLGLMILSLANTSTSGRINNNVHAVKILFNLINITNSSHCQHNRHTLLHPFASMVHRDQKMLEQSTHQQSLSHCEPRFLNKNKKYVSSGQKQRKGQPSVECSTP